MQLGSGPGRTTQSSSSSALLLSSADPLPLLRFLGTLDLGGKDLELPPRVRLDKRQSAGECSRKYLPDDASFGQPLPLVVMTSPNCGKVVHHDSSSSAPIVYQSPPESEIEQSCPPRDPSEKLDKDLKKPVGEWFVTRESSSQSENASLRKLLLLAGDAELTEHIQMKGEYAQCSEMPRLQQLLGRYLSNSIAFWL